MSLTGIALAMRPKAMPGPRGVLSAILLLSRQWMPAEAVLVRLLRAVACVHDASDRGALRS